MTEVVLKIEDLTVLLNINGATLKAVDTLSLTLHRGETYCLVGESGSGKSVTALSVLGLLPSRLAEYPTGAVYLYGDNAGDDLLKASDTTMKAVRGARIAMIFQEPMTSLNPVLTIGEQVSEAISLHNPELSLKQVYQQALSALQQVQLKEAETRINDYPHRLSGGQRQRVMIAMAMACKPDILIADEPTTALDVTVQAEILGLMKTLQQDTGMAILLITHDFGVVANMADRVGVLRQGQLVEENTLDDLLRSPQHDYTKLLLSALPENLPREKKKGIIDSVSQPIVEIRNLKLWFPIYQGVFRRHVGDMKAVDGIDLAIYAGEIVALVGESGCGKSTLGRAIIQLIKTTRGEVYFHDQLLTGLSKKAMQPLRRRMQIIFQDPLSSLNPRLNIATTLTEPMQVHGIGNTYEERIELAYQALEDVHLKREHLWRLPHSFSGGQRQRIGIARALVLEPEFIVCDEVTSALDVSVQADILKMLMQLRDQRNLSLLFITHDIAVVEYVSDRTVVMHSGKIIEQGQTQIVCNNPQERYTQQLLEAVPRLPSDMFN